MLFKCSKHKSVKQEHSKFTMKIKGDQSVFVVDKEIIVCPKCGKPLESVEEAGEYTVNYGKYSSMSREDKKAHIKARAKKFNKLPVNREYKRHLDLEHLKGNKQ